MASSGGGIVVGSSGSTNPHRSRRSWGWNSVEVGEKVAIGADRELLSALLTVPPVKRVDGVCPRARSPLEAGQIPQTAYLAAVERNEEAVRLCHEPQRRPPCHLADRPSEGGIPAVQVGRHEVDVLCAEP